MSHFYTAATHGELIEIKMPGQKDHCAKAPHPFAD